MICTVHTRAVWYQSIVIKLVEANHSCCGWTLHSLELGTLAQLTAFAAVIPPLAVTLPSFQLAFFISSPV